MKNKISQSGFTLIELMIVVLIISIIMMVGLPSYKQYVTKTRRVDATGNLLELSQYMERYYTENGCYHQSPCAGGGAALALPFNKSPKEGTTTHYNLTIPTLTATTFTLNATPINDQLSSDTDCGTLTLSHTGVKCILAGASCSDSATASVQEAVADCW